MQTFIWFVWATAVFIFLMTIAGWVAYDYLSQTSPNKFQPEKQPSLERSFYDVEI